MKLFALLAASLLGSGTFGQLPVHGVKPAGSRLHARAVNCTLRTLAMNFGAYAPLGANQTTPLTANGTLKVRCTGGTATYSLTANNGQNSSNATSTCATGACTRAMRIGATTAYVSYDLYTDAGYTTIWDATNAITDTGGGGGGTTETFYGYVPPGIANTAGTYTDSVTVTVTF